MMPQTREMEQPERRGKCWGRDGPDGAEGAAEQGVDWSWGFRPPAIAEFQNIAACEATGPGPSQGV